jgi:anti-anti-sigma factor
MRLDLALDLAAATGPVMVVIVSPWWAVNDSRENQYPSNCHINADGGPSRPGGVESGGTHWSEPVFFPHAGVIALFGARLALAGGPAPVKPLITACEARIAMTASVWPHGPRGDQLASITFSTSGTSCVLTVSGEIDMSNAEQLRAEMERGIDDSGCLHLLVDLSGLNYLGSDGIRTLIRLRRHVCDRGGDVAMTHPTASVRAVLDLTGVSRLLGLRS